MPADKKIVAHNSDNEVPDTKNYNEDTWDMLSCWVDKLVLM